MPGQTLPVTPSFWLNPHAFIALIRTPAGDYRYLTSNDEPITLDPGPYAESIIAAVQSIGAQAHNIIFNGESYARILFIEDANAAEIIYPRNITITVSDPLAIAALRAWCIQNDKQKPAIYEVSSGPGFEVASEKPH